VGPARGFQRAVRLGELSPGPRTERRRPRWHAEEKNGACPVTKHRKEADSVRVWRWHHSSVQFSSVQFSSVQRRDCLSHSAFARARPWTPQRVTGRGPSARRVARIHQIAPVDFVESRRGIVWVRRPTRVDYRPPVGPHAIRFNQPTQFSPKSHGRERVGGLRENCLPWPASFLHMKVGGRLIGSDSNLPLVIILTAQRQISTPCRSTWQSCSR